jgi:hypothetical protein
VVYCRALDFLGAAWDVDPARLRALDPAVDVDVVCASLEHIRSICAGEPAGDLPPRHPDRRTFSAGSPRPAARSSTPAPIHSGVTTTPAADLDHLLNAFVR